MKQPKIAIIGYATRLPQTSDERFWQDLIAGKDFITQVEENRWAQYGFAHPLRAHPGTSVTFAAGSLGEISGFDATFFRVSPREAAAMDPQQRILLEMSWEALAVAGIDPVRLKGSRTGVFIGLASTDYAYRLADDLPAIGTNTATGVTASIAANRLSYFYDLRGPSMAVDTACSSALVAFHEACESIRQGESELALTGAINLHLHPFGFLIFSKASMLSPRGRCRPFDASADGYVRSEGGGIFVLKDYDRARRDGDPILAIVAESAINCDGNKSGLTVPSSAAQSDLLEAVYRKAGIDPEQIHYIEAHGTGTAVGDPIEVAAIGEALGRHHRAKAPLAIGSVKSNIGHLETASGVPGLLKAMHCLRERVVPATIGICELNPRLNLEALNLHVVRENRPLPETGKLIVGVNSFGFGGANAHVILESPEPRRERPAHWPRRGRRLRMLPLMLTAATQTALKRVAQDVAACLSGEEETDYAILYRSNFHRAVLKERLILRGNNGQSLQRQLADFAAGKGAPALVMGQALPNPRGPVFVFSGNGCQWEGMGRALLSDPVFAATLAEIDRHFVPLAGYSLRDDLAGKLDCGRYQRTEQAQPALFALQLGLTAMLRAEGIDPVAVVGHSVGEVAAAWACGSLDLADAVRVIYERSRLQGYCYGQGGMTAVACDGDTLEQLLERWGLADRIELAAWNSVRGATAVGPVDALEQMEGHLRAQGTALKRLDIAYPFHSTQMDPLRDELLAALEAVQAKTSRIPFVSAVTGTVVPGETLGATYWWRNIREPVRFQQAASTLLADWNCFVELGGHPVLRNYLQDALKDTDREGRIAETLRRDREDPDAVWNAAAELWIAGIPRSWQHHFPKRPPVVQLPHYPWERERHWHDVTAESAGVLYGFPRHPLLGHPLNQHPGEWEQVVDVERVPFLADHRVGEGIVFAGAAYVEMFLAAAQAQYPDNCHLLLEELEIRAPLLLEPGNSKILRLRLTEDGWAEIRARTQLEAEWTLHARARLGSGNAHLSAAPGKLAEFATIIAQDPDFTRGQHYGLTEKVGLHYGPAFQSVEKGWVREDRVLASLCLGETASEGFLLHPALFDGALQCLADWLARSGAADSGWGFVPNRIESLHWWQSAPTALWAELRVSKQSAQSVLVDVLLLDAKSRPVAEAKGVRLRRVRLQHGERERLRFLESRLVPQPQKGDVLSPLPQDAIGQRLQELLQDIPARTRYLEEFAPLLESLLQRYSEEASGQTRDEIQATDIWQTLLQDYPEFFPMTLQAGRWGLHRAGLGENDKGIAFVESAQRNVLSTLTPTLVAFLTDTVAALRQSLPAHRALRILEIGSGIAEGLPALQAAAAEDQRLQLFLVTERIEEATESRHWTTLTWQSDDRPDADLIWLRLDATETERQWAMLRFAAQSLADGGVLLLQGVVPEETWQNIDASSSAILPQGLCLDWLSQQGLRPLPGTELPQLGPYAVLLSKSSPLPASPRPLDEEWWVVPAPSVSENSPELAAISDHWRQRGVRVHLGDQPPTHTVCGKVLFVDRPQALENDPLPRLTQSCDTLARLGRWAVRQEPPTPLFLLSAGGVQALHAESMEARHSADALQAAALCGFARSLQNEWPELGIKILDLGTGPWTDAQIVSLTRFLADPDAETEMILDPEGQRLVPRVREIAYPWPSSTVSPTASTEVAHVQKLSFSVPGLLRNLHWQAYALGAPLAAQEIRVEVEYTGLNFRDVMYALGMLADEALENGFSGLGLGLEFSGRIVEVGSAVQRWSPGDRVMGFASSSFATQLRTLETAVSAVPEGIGMDAAAAIPTVFLTAWYALQEMARLEAGERVLIHGGAGGVGIAAIQIAQLLGAEVFATAGSPEKRDFLRLLRVSQVYDSRSLDFADAILQDTQGEGVDVVLNSLSGEAIRRNLQVLRPFGRFLEIGKRDFFENRPMHLRPFRNNLSYFGVDADQLLAGRPAVTRRVFQEVVEHLTQGDLFPLPVTAFPATQVVEAFRYMQQAKHIGKIVVAMRTPIVNSVPPAATDAPKLALDPDGLYLVTGGTGGFGLATARRLVERGARHLLLISRSGRLDTRAQAQWGEMAALGAVVECRACDVSDTEQMEELFAQIRTQQRPLRGIVHAAAVIEDGLAENLTPAKIQEVLAPKVRGAWHLHRLSLGHPLDFFIVYSSITTLLGNPGQSSYVAANAWLEGLAQLRRSQDLPALAVLWGPIADVGYLTRHEQTRDRLTQRLGGAALSANLALDLLEGLLSAERNGVVVANWDWQAISRFLPTALAPRFADLSEGIVDGGGLSDSDLQEQIRLLPENEAEALLSELVRREVAQILRLDPEKIGGNQDLSHLGLDSLMGVELALALEERLGIKLPAFLLSEGPTADRLAQRLVHSLRKNGLEEGSSLSPDRETLEQLAKQHGVASDGEAIEQIFANGSH